jgi:hypothetical protein
MPKRPAKSEIYSWSVYRLRGTPAQFVGIVYNQPDERAAIKQAIEEFKIVTLWPSCDTITGRSSKGLDMHFPSLLSLVLALLAVVGVFIEIPFVSNYAFWIMTAAYVLIISSTTLDKK